MSSRKYSPLAVLLLLALIALTGSVYAGEAVEVDSTTGEDRTRVEIHKVVRFCEEGDEDCADEGIRKIIIAGDGEHGGVPYVLHHGGSGHETMAGLHHFSDRAFLGVQLTELTPELRRHFGAPENAGVMVAKVVDDSPAFRAGVEVGDIITAVGETEVSSSHELSRDIGLREEGDVVDLEIWRDGGVERISATLEKRQGPGMQSHRVLMGGCEEGDCGTHIVKRIHCDGDEPCEVEVRCDGGECSCTVDGEPMDCEEIHREHGRD